MKIAFTGPQSSGKTTLIKNLELEPSLQHFKTFKEITRELKAQGFPINEAGTDETQQAIMREHLRRLDFKGDAIYDRCVLDGVVYTDYLYQMKKVSKVTLRAAGIVFLNSIRKYDYLFYCEPVVLEDDGVRSVDTTFRDHIVSLFDDYITSYIDFPIIVLKGNQDERLRKVKEVLYGL